jgi:hypothetical protein
MKIALSTIKDLHNLVWRRDSLSKVNNGGGRLSFIGMLFQILLRQINIWLFSHGRREEYYPRNICLGCYVFDNGDSYSRFTSNVDKSIRLLFSGILVWILLPMMIDYINGCARAYRLDIVAQTKIMRESSLVFSGLWFVIYFWLLPEKYKIVLWKKKEFKDLKVLLVSFGFYFIIVKISPCISTMYSLRSQI